MQPPRPEKFDVVVFGNGFPDWLAVLAADTPLWQTLARVNSVARRGDRWDGADSAPETRLVLPLLERNIGNCPAGWALVPHADGLSILADKALFARYMKRIGLERFAPVTYWTADAIEFPAIVKRTDLFWGKGVRIAWSKEELDEILAEDPWAGHPVVFQEYVPGGLEYVLQCIVVKGLVVWQKAYEIVIPAEAPIRHPHQNETVRIVDIPARELFDLQRIIAPLGFTGPINFNYRRRLDGTVAVFEINPRFGGSLFRPMSSAVLAEAIGTIIEQAVWHEPKQASG